MEVPLFLTCRQFQDLEEQQKTRSEGRDLILRQEIARRRDPPRLLLQANVTEAITIFLLPHLFTRLATADFLWCQNHL
jgi:hypothetical protein